MFSFLRLSFSQSRIFSRCSSRRFCYEFPIRHPAETEAVGTTWCWYLHWLCWYRLSYLEFTWQLQRMTNGTNNSHGSSLAAILDVRNVGISCQQIGSWLTSQHPGFHPDLHLFLLIHFSFLLSTFLAWFVQFEQLRPTTRESIWILQFDPSITVMLEGHYFDWCKKKGGVPLTLGVPFSTEKMCWDSRPFPFLQQPIRLCSQKFIKAPFFKHPRKRARNDDFSYMELAFDKQVLKQRVKDRSTTYL